MLRFDDPLPFRPSRVLVAGVSGVGKTSLATRIAEALSLPRTELDSLYHGPHWVPRTEFMREVHALAAAETWVTEWQYTKAKPVLTARAELIVWLDLPFFTTAFPRVVKRTIRRSTKREQLWNGNIEPPLSTFFTDRKHIIKWAWATRNLCREQVPELEVTHPGLVFVRLRSQRKVDLWLLHQLLKQKAIS